MAHSSQKQLKKVLFGVLNWGLGHATRSIPIIHFLLSKGVEVDIASDGAAGEILKEEFPVLRHFNLPAYSISYTKHAALLPFKLLCQAPGIIQSVNAENLWLEKHLLKNEYDLIVSDNRYGFYSDELTSVIITHQLKLNLPAGVKWLNRWLEKRLQKFHHIWVPDRNGMLSGELSKTSKLNRTEIGFWTAYKKIDCKKDVDLLVILSGPEPQRSILEKQLADNLLEQAREVVVVRGTKKPVNVTYSKNVVTHDLIPPSELNELLNRSKLACCRSGYSSLMDLVELEIPAILIPTPGQTEQEFLAKRLVQNSQFFIAEQQNLKNLDLKKVSEKLKAQKSPGNSPEALISALKQLNYIMPA